MVWYTDPKDNKSHKKIVLLKLPSPPPAIKPVKEYQPPVKISNRFKDLVQAYWQQYCEKSTIHGVRYIYDPTLRGIERLIWSTLVIACVTLTCIAYVILTERYSAHKLQTVVENSQYPVFKIPFPAVAVCVHNRINWSKFEQAKATFLPASADNATIKAFTDFVLRMDSLRFQYFDDFKDMEDDLERIDFIDVTKLAKFMALRCEDIFANGSCLWSQMNVNCCSRFVLEPTEYGFCLVFNSVLSEESWAIENKLGKQYYPYHNSKAGQKTGLFFRIVIDKKLLSPVTKPENSISIIIKRNDQLAEVGYTITPKTKTFFIVRPQKTKSDEGLQILDPMTRNCYFENEFHSELSQTNMTKKCILNNCLNKCHENHVIEYCNCTLPLFFLFPNKSVEECTPSKFRCLAKHSDIFSYDKYNEEDAYFNSVKPGMECSCLVSCNSIEYFASLTTLPLCDEVTKDPNTDIYDVDVHYQSEVFVQYRTSLEFTSIDLIANFGGIFGLCLGASLVSAVELFYYATFGFALYLYYNKYFTIFKANLKNFKQNLINSFKNSFEEEDDADHINENCVIVKHHQPMHRTNRW